MILGDEHFEYVLQKAERSIEACVVVGGTLLQGNYKNLKSCVARGVEFKFLFPDPHSSWLIPIISATGLPIKAYQQRITGNAQKAQELGSSIEIRWHSNPINKWFVIIDRSVVASKPFDVTAETFPSIENRPEVIQYYLRLFDSIWASAINKHTKILDAERITDNQFAKLRIFLCHSSEDKPAVRELYSRLVELGIDVWLDEVKLLPGQNWDREIKLALKEAHVILACLSRKSIKRKGYMYKELRNALHIAQEYPEGTLFIIPTRLDDVQLPESLAHLQWVNIYEKPGYERLIESLRLRTKELATD